MFIYANYGAMFPTQTLAVKAISAGFITATHEDGHEEKIDLARVRDSRPTSGSPIGLYWNERDAY
jgi:hypothetical protein